jgi:hypothetical protein
VEGALGGALEAIRGREPRYSAEESRVLEVHVGQGQDQDQDQDASHQARQSAAEAGHNLRRPVRLCECSKGPIYWRHDRHSPFIEGADP